MGLKIRDRLENMGKKFLTSRQENKKIHKSSRVFTPKPRKNMCECAIALYKSWIGERQKCRGKKYK